MLRRTAFCLSSTHTLLSTHGAFRLLADSAKPNNGVLTIEIKGRTKYNLLDNDFLAGMHSVTAEVDGMENARVVILKAADGHHFSAGLDLKRSMEIFMKDVPTSQKLKAAASAATGVGSPTIGESASLGMPAMRNMALHKLIKRWQDAISSLARCRVPVIAAIDKYCIGGASSIVTACDMRYSTDDAVFSVREPKVGITADIGALQRLGGIVGEGVARELCYTARDFKGQEAQELRFVNKSFATADDMYAHAQKIAEEIAGCSPIAVQGTKEVFTFQTERSAQESLDRVRLWNTAFIKSDDLVRAGLAFAKKKSPQFEDYVVDSRTSFPENVGVKGE